MIRARHHPDPVRAGPSGRHGSPRPRALPTGHATATTAGRSALLRVRSMGVVALDDRRLVADLDPLVAATLLLARDHGAPIGPVLDAAGRAADLDQRIAADVVAAVAPARTVARSLLALPVVAVPVLGAVAGVDLVGFYLHDPAGRWVALGVAGLLALAALWMRVVLSTVAPGGSSHRGGGGPILVGLVLVVAGMVIPGLLVVALGVRRRMVRPPHEVAPGLPAVADLAATALSAGHDLAGSLRLAADHLPAVLEDAVAAARLGQRIRRLAFALVLQPPTAERAVHLRSTGSDDAIAPLIDAVAVLATSGEPGVDVLRGVARRLREDHARRARAAAAQLPARLTFPTALVLVPATVLAIGVPIIAQGLAALAPT